MESLSDAATLPGKQPPWLRHYGAIPAELPPRNTPTWPR